AFLTRSVRAAHPAEYAVSYRGAIRAAHAAQRSKRGAASRLLRCAACAAPTNTTDSSGQSTSIDEVSLGRTGGPAADAADHSTRRGRGWGRGGGRRRRHIEAFPEVVALAYLVRAQHDEEHIVPPRRAAERAQRVDAVEVAGRLVFRDRVLAR